MQTPTEFIQIWCHNCNSPSRALANVMLCNVCDSSFVEEANQGVETFLQPSDPIDTSTNGYSNNISASSSSGHPPDLSHTARQILDFVGANSNYQSPQLLLPHDSSGRRPVGIVMRTMPISLYESSSSGNFAEEILNLFGSLRAARFNSHDADAMSNNQFEQFLHHILMNENSHHGVPPASQEFIENLSRLTIENEEQIRTLGECSISQESFEIGDCVVSLPCGHNYKEDSIIQWLKLHSTCPVCRIEMGKPENANSQ